MSELAIQVENLSKRYRIGAAQARHDTLRDAFTGLLRRRSARAPRPVETRAGEEEIFWALRDVSFEVKAGEVVGVIGQNGAGKSTLLKILARITEPSAGRAEIYGRVGSLLEVGTGFHPELTGRENIYLNGAILGMRRAEIAAKFDEIVAFAEIEQFLDTPVKRYSSGMYVRLAFAVAAHLEPEILLVDEVLAVGDAAFQKKCLGKMGDVAREGRTVFFVSHNMAAVQALCGKALWLQGGRQMYYGMIGDAIDAYLGSIQRAKEVRLDLRQDRTGNGQLRFAEVVASHDMQADFLICGRSAYFIIRYEATANTPIRNATVSLTVNALLGDNLLFLSNELVGVEFAELPRQGSFVCAIDKLPLVAGIYSLNLYCTVDGDLADWVIDAARITVEPGDYFGTGRQVPPTHSRILTAQRWSMDNCLPN